jgi:hypothetical protein
VEVAGGTAKVAVAGVEIEIIKAFESDEGIGHFTAHVDLGFDGTGVRIRPNGNQPGQLAAKGLRRAVREVFCLNVGHRNFSLIIVIAGQAADRVLWPPGAGDQRGCEKQAAGGLDAAAHE